MLRSTYSFRAVVHTMQSPGVSSYASCIAVELYGCCTFLVLDTKTGAGDVLRRQDTTPSNCTVLNLATLASNIWAPAQARHNTIGTCLPSSRDACKWCFISPPRTSRGEALSPWSCTGLSSGGGRARQGGRPVLTFFSKASQSRSQLEEKG